MKSDMWLCMGFFLWKVFNESFALLRLFQLLCQVLDTTYLGQLG